MLLISVGSTITKFKYWYKGRKLVDFRLEIGQIYQGNLFKKGDDIHLVSEIIVNSRYWQEI